MLLVTKCSDRYYKGIIHKLRTFAVKSGTDVALLLCQTVQSKKLAQINDGLLPCVWFDEPLHWSCHVYCYVEDSGC